MFGGATPFPSGPALSDEGGNTRNARLDERRLPETVGRDARCLRLDGPKYLLGLVRLGQMQVAGKWRIPKYPVRP